MDDPIVVIEGDEGDSTVNFNKKSLIDTLDSMPTSPLVNPPCKACSTLSNFSEAEVDTFHDYLLSGSITLDGLSSALLRHGYSVSEKTLRRHKRNCLGNTHESD